MVTAPGQLGYPSGAFSEDQLNQHFPFPPIGPNREDEQMLQKSSPSFGVTAARVAKAAEDLLAQPQSNGAGGPLTDLFGFDIEAFPLELGLDFSHLTDKTAAAAPPYSLPMPEAPAAAAAAPPHSASPLQLDPFGGKGDTQLQIDLFDVATFPLELGFDSNPLTGETATAAPPLSSPLAAAAAAPHHSVSPLQLDFLPGITDSDLEIGDSELEIAALSFAAGIDFNLLNRETATAAPPYSLPIPAAAAALDDASREDDSNDPPHAERERTAIRSKKRVCPEDGKAFRTPAELEKHIKEYHPNGFRCLWVDCQTKLFGTALLLNQHRQSEHGIKSTGTETEAYLCGHCNHKPAFTKKQILEHLMCSHSKSTIPRPTEKIVNSMLRYVDITKSPNKPNTSVFTLKPDNLRT